jgi:hypothetical protein
MDEGRKLCRVLTGKSEVKRPLERPRCRCVDGIRMDLKEIGRGLWNGFVWLRILTVGWLL